MSRVRRLVTGLVDRTRRAVANRFARIHPRPVFVLGNQKSGTSAVAALVAAAAEVEATLDIPGIHGAEQERLHSGRTSLAQFVRRNRLDFSRPIVKEPALTFLFEPLSRTFPGAPMAFVVRDPRANLRSILNRLGLPGDRELLDETELARVARHGPNWRRMLEGWLGATGDTYVERLAARWNVAADVYLERPERFELLRYEDFVADKEGSIADLARRLGLEPRRALGDLVDHPFQPPGDRSVPAQDFFGTANLERIERSCARRMRVFGYA